MQQQYIGTVAILWDRAYDDLMVPAGTYPVGRNDDGYFFDLSGYPITPAGTIERLDGDEESSLFMVHPIDTLRKDDMRPREFRRYIQGDWQEFLRDPLCRPGPEQRLVIRLEGEEV